MKRFQILNEEKETFELWGWKVSYVPTFFFFNNVAYYQ